jgi:hypothetical protein
VVTAHVGDDYDYEKFIGAFSDALMFFSLNDTLLTLNQNLLDLDVSSFCFIS